VGGEEVGEEYDTGGWRLRGPGWEPTGGGGKWPSAPERTPVGGRVGAWCWEQEEQSTFSLLYFGSLQDGYIDLAE
jgi:hypothetical protein